MGTKDSFESTGLLSRIYFNLDTQDKVMHNQCWSKARVKRAYQPGSTKESYKDESTNIVHVAKEGQSDYFKEGD